MPVNTLTNRDFSEQGRLHNRQKRPDSVPSKSCISSRWTLVKNSLAFRLPCERHPQERDQIGGILRTDLRM